MQIKLRSKHGGRLVVLDENENVIDVLGIEVHAAAPDFIPEVKLRLLGTEVVLDAEAIKEPVNVGYQPRKSVGEPVPPPRKP